MPVFLPPLNKLLFTFGPTQSMNRNSNFLNRINGIFNEMKKYGD